MLSISDEEIRLGLLTTEDVLKILKKNNPVTVKLTRFLTNYNSNINRIYKKNSQIMLGLGDRLSADCLPVVDRKLGLVFETNRYTQVLAGILFGYHVSDTKSNRHIHMYDERKWAEYYYRLGFGYFFSYDRTAGDILINIEPVNHWHDDCDLVLFKKINLRI